MDYEDIDEGLWGYEEKLGGYDESPLSPYEEEERFVKYDDSPENIKTSHSGSPEEWVNPETVTEATWKELQHTHKFVGSEKGRASFPERMRATIHKIIEENEFREINTERVAQAFLEIQTIEYLNIEILTFAYYYHYHIKILNSENLDEFVKNTGINRDDMIRYIRYAKRVF